MLVPIALVRVNEPAGRLRSCEERISWISSLFLVGHLGRTLLDV